MSAQSPSTITMTLPVLWGDMDALGHVNNVRYFRWFESARIALCESLGILTRVAGPTTVGPILATTSCDFLTPVHYPGSVAITAAVTRVGETSVTMGYEIRDTDGGGDKVYARGSSVIVLVDYATMKKVRVPEDVRAKIGPLAPA
jgi:acyl-CoA thioester hydrolase